MIVKRKGDEIWISLGGKPEVGESLEQALVREVKEEISCEVINTPKLYLQSPIEPAMGKPGLTVQITAYLTEIVGEPKINPDDKTEMLHWLSKAEFENHDFPLGSVLELDVIPKLIAEGLMS